MTRPPADKPARSHFGFERPRRLRTTPAMRELVAENHVRPAQLIQPYFVVPGNGQEQKINGLPGINRLSVDTLLPEVEKALNLGLRSVMLFGVVPGDDKNAAGSGATDPDGPVPAALRALRANFGDDILLMSDICLCAYTDHGHCGLLSGHGNRVHIDDDRSLPALAAMAELHAESGADIVAPSDMMDGRIGHIRQHLDALGWSDTAILSYAVKYASAFYGPFREAAGSAERLGRHRCPQRPRQLPDGPAQLPRGAARGPPRRE